jgi:hypothetical protein
VFSLGYFGRDVAVGYFHIELSRSPDLRSEKNFPCSSLSVVSRVLCLYASG